LRHCAPGDEEDEREKKDDDAGSGAQQPGWRRVAVEEWLAGYRTWLTDSEQAQLT